MSEELGIVKGCEEEDGCVMQLLLKYVGKCGACSSPIRPVPTAHYARTVMKVSGCLADYCRCNGSPVKGIPKYEVSL